MPPVHVRPLLVLAALGFAAVPIATAGAETLAELDAMSDASVDEERGISAAREQESRGELLEAVATLERVLAENPKSAAARLLHAVYLCRIDDPEGGRVELSKLDEKQYAAEVMTQAQEACAGLPGGRP